MKRAEILANRQKWIERLLNPESKKQIGLLVNLDTGAACCLGHGCVALDIKISDINVSSDDYDGEQIKIASYKDIGVDGYAIRNSYTAPKNFIEMVGLWDSIGNPIDDVPIQFPNGNTYNGLSSANDSIDDHVTTQEIGEYLQSVIEGGDHTPFKPLSIYEE